MQSCVHTPIQTHPHGHVCIFTCIYTYIYVFVCVCRWCLYIHKQTQTAGEGAHAHASTHKHRAHWLHNHRAMPVLLLVPDQHYEKLRVGVPCAAHAVRTTISRWTWISWKQNKRDCMFETWWPPERFKTGFSISRIFLSIWPWLNSFSWTFKS